MQQTTASDGEVVVAFDKLVQACSDALVALGVPRADASLQAWVLAEAEARAHPSHGIRRLKIILERIQNGLVEIAPRVQMTWKASGALAVDGGNSLGPSVAFQSADALLERAPEVGIAAAAIRNSNHLGMLALYVERMAKRGFIGIAMTTSEALVHPWGGRKAMVGTNPLAIAVPATPEPLVLDMATAEVSKGKILAYQALGATLGEGWAVDVEGNPTTDPALAARGALSPFGGPKGYALGVALEALVASLTGTALGKEVVGTLDSEFHCNKGDFLICLSPSRFGVSDAAVQVGAYLDALRGSEPFDPDHPVRTPGDRTRLTRRDRHATGVPVAKEVWHEVCRLNREHTQQKS